MGWREGGRCGGEGIQYCVYTHAICNFLSVLHTCIYFVDSVKKQCAHTCW